MILFSLYCIVNRPIAMELPVNISEHTHGPGVASAVALLYYSVAKLWFYSEKFFLSGLEIVI